MKKTIDMQALLEWIKIIDANHMVYPELIPPDSRDNTQSSEDNEKDNEAV